MSAHFSEFKSSISQQCVAASQGLKLELLVIRIASILKEFNYLIDFKLTSITYQSIWIGILINSNSSEIWQAQIISNRVALLFQQNNTESYITILN